MTNHTTDHNAINTNDLSKLGQVALVSIDITVWSGQAKLSAKDLKGVSHLPSEKVAQLGNKKICDPQKLKVFNTLREQARVALQEVGMPLLGGYAIPLDQLANTHSFLQGVMQRFEHAKNDFLASYDQAVTEWIDENPGDADLIRSGIIDSADVARRLHADYQVFNIAPVGGMEDGLERAAGGMSTELIEEVKTKTGKFYEKHIRKGGMVDRRTRSVFSHLAKKVSGLTFLDSRFDGLLDLLEETKGIYDASKSAISGSEFQHLKANTLILSTDHIQDYLDKQPVKVSDDSWDDLDDDANADASNNAVPDDASSFNEDASGVSDLDMDYAEQEKAKATSETADAQEESEDPFAALEEMLGGAALGEDDTSVSTSEPSEEKASEEGTADSSVTPTEDVNTNDSGFNEVMVEEEEVASPTPSANDTNDFTVVMEDEIEENFDW